MIQDQDFPRCNHIKVNGVRCGSPAIREKMYCYFHGRLRRLRASPVMPMLEDGNAIQFGISEVIQAIVEERIDHKQASLLIYALQVAAYNLRTGQVDFEPAPEDVVRVDPADEYFTDAMKQLPQNAPEADVLEIIKTAAKG